MADKLKDFRSLGAAMTGDVPPDSDKNADIYNKVPESAEAAEAKPDEQQQPEQQADTPQEGVRDERAPRKSPHDRRKEMVSRRLQRRNGEDVEDDAAPVSAANIELGTAFQNYRKDEEPEAPPVETPPVPEKKPVKLRVDHQDVELTEAERDEYARIGKAQGNRLAELNALVAETRNYLARMREQEQITARRDSQAPQQADDATPDTARQPQPSVSAEDLRDIAEKLQIGDAEEGAQALQALLERAPRPQQPVSVNPDEIAARVEAQIVAREAERAETERFVAQHREIASDPIMQNATAFELHRLMVGELHNLATKIGVNPAELAPAERDPGLAIEWYRQYQAAGYTLTPAQRMVDEAATRVEQRYRLREDQMATPPVDNRTEQRAAEKRQIQQPRRANVISRPPAAPQVTPRTDTIKQMRAQRGFTNLN